MRGLWHLRSRVIDPGLAVIIFNSIVAFVVVLFTCASIARRSQLWPETWTVNLGMLLLSFWLVLHLIDLVVHHHHVHLPYAYIIVGFFYNVFRVCSDVFVLGGTWRVLIRYDNLRPNVKETESLRITVAAAGLLGVLALYHLCFLFALSFAWLSFADLDVINEIAKARSGFEIAFTALMFTCTIGTTLWAGSMQIRDIPTRSPYKEIVYSVPASAALLIRSFCEVVIVGQLDRAPTHIQVTARARDVTYGLFSMIFVVCMTFAVPEKAAKDLLVEMERTAVEYVATWLTQKLADMTQHGRKTAPAISTLLETLERELRHISGHDADMKRKEIKRLEALYHDWEPIHKWPGAGQGSEAVLNTPSNVSS